MKLRTRSGSIRVRLAQAEVAALAGGTALEEVVDVAPGAAFACRLVASDDASGIGARLTGATLTIELPTALVQAWAGSERVGLEATQLVEGKRPLVILVEKDFACLAPRAEDADAFPNPAAERGARC